MQNVVAGRHRARAAFGSRSDSSRLAIYVIGGSGSPTGHRLLGAACPAASATSVTLRDGNTLPLATLRQQSNASGVSPCAP